MQQYTILQLNKVICAKLKSSTIYNIKKSYKRHNFRQAHDDIWS